MIYKSKKILVTLNTKLLRDIDKLKTKNNFVNRSEFIRDILSRYVNTTKIRKQYHLGN